MVSVQRRAALAYGVLSRQAPQWAHRLLLIGQAGSESLSVMAAGIAVGAAVLVVEEDAAIARSSIQLGIADFLVKTLDEALRILKNEVRKGVSVCVVLLGEQQPILAEMAERGIQADYVWRSEVGDETPAMQEGLCASHATTLMERRAMDDRLLQQEQSEVAAQWLRAAVRLFPRDLDRWSVS